MSDSVAFVWDEALCAYDFGPQHPLQPVRLKLTYELARICGVLEHVEVVAPPVAARADLERVHTPEFLDAVEHLSAVVDDPYGKYGFGLGTQPGGNTDTPAVRGMHEVSSLIAGGSVAAASRVWGGASDHAFNQAGGLHHAMADRASGFCIYNDASVAIAWLLANGAKRVVYVDVDVHHGDGVQAAFYNDPRVLTVSLHESGYFLFPGTGFPDETGGPNAIGTSVNVALPPYAGDAAYREAFDAIVPPLIESFRPEVLVTQLGCDTHATDPLAHLALTTRTYRFVARAFHDLAHAVTGGKWLALGGGGYQRYAVVPRAWTIYAAEQARVELPGVLPAEWIDLAHDLGAPELPNPFDDPEVAFPPGVEAEATEGVRAAVAETMASVFPHHGL